MKAKCKRLDKNRRYVELGLVGKAEGSSAPLPSAVANGVEALQALVREHSLKVRLRAVRSSVHPPGDDEAAWLDTWESLDLEDQVRVLALSAHVGFAPEGETRKALKSSTNRPLRSTA